MIQADIEMKIYCKMRCYISETPWTHQKVYKTGVGANENIEIR